MTKDLERITNNHKILLETLPDIIILLRDDGSIEYKNENAIPFFKECEDLLGKTILQIQLQRLLKSFLSGENTGRPSLGIVNNHSFEYRIGPFTGYRGESLYWLTMKSITESMSTKPEIGYDDSSKKTVVGTSGAMSDLLNMISHVAQTDTTVLINGESGTGKELVANLIRQQSNRNDKPFLAINCSAIIDTLLESDLFGFEKGAFTGAHAKQKGKFEAVDGGTIFLDEIGDISLRMQAVLLRVLQHGEIIRVGGTEAIKVDVRIIAATNCDLKQAVKAGKFRLDLFYRLNIFNISVPPLRERREDILELTSHFVEKYNRIFKRDINFTPDTIKTQLETYHWPGNIRELENVIQRAVLLSKTNMITGEDICFDMAVETEQTESLSPDVLRKFNGSPLKGIVEQIEKEVILHKLMINRGNVAETAETLDISKASLYGKMKRYDISAKTIR